MAISNMPSIELAYQEWQRQAIPHITRHWRNRAARGSI